MDPALPGFHLLTSDKTRLDSTDAAFVDIIHSCGGVLGYLQPLGSVDFYPNAGTAVQPGCCCLPEVIGNIVIVTIFQQILRRIFLYTESCSHGRAYVYFSESIGSKVGFMAHKCDTWDQFMQGSCDQTKTVLMGEHVEQTATGTYFLRTRSEPPYAKLAETTDNMV